MTSPDIAILREEAAEQSRKLACFDELVAALEDAAAIAAMCAELADDVPLNCDGDGLCGSNICDEIGCLCDKRERIGAVLALAKADLS
jgi:hypothetical protein